MNTPWEIIDAFNSPREYDRLKEWLNLQVEEGHAIEIPTPYPDFERRYQCDDGREWVLKAPDFPLRGSFEPV